MFGDMFANQLTMYECSFDVEVDGERQIQQMTAPRIMIEQQFMQLMQNAAQDRRPVRIVLSRDVDCVDKWTGEEFVRECSIEFKNKSYVNYEENGV